jgi:hypothetical protein
LKETNLTGQRLFEASKRGASPYFFSSPSPFKERGIKGVRLINALYR